MSDKVKSIEEKPKYTRRHLSANIEGMLRNYKHRKMTKLFQDEDGNFLTDREARSYLMSCKRVIPLGDCPTFYYHTGCPDHEITKEEYESKH